MSRFVEWLKPKPKPTAKPKAASPPAPKPKGVSQEPERVSQKLAPFKKLRKHKGRYSDEEIERALTLRVTMGSRKKAAEVAGVDPQTLHDWISRTHKERYEEIRNELVPKMREQVRQESLELARRYGEDEHKTLEIIEARLSDPEELKKIQSKDLAGINRNMAVGRGISIDKFKDLSDETITLPAVEEYDSIVMKWERRGVKIVNATQEGVPKAIEGSAEEGVPNVQSDSPATQEGVP